MNKSFGEFIKKNFDVIETVLAVLFSASLLMIINEINYATEGVWISLSAIAILYWLMAILPVEQKEETFELLFRKIKWLGLSLAIIGILLAIQLSEKADYLLIAGTIICAIILILIIYNGIKNKNRKETISSAIRTFLIGLISIYLLALNI